MSRNPCTAPSLPQCDAAATPWITAARPTTLGIVATVAVAFLSALAMIQPGSAEAQASASIVTAVMGV